MFTSKVVLLDSVVDSNMDLRVTRGGGTRNVAKDN